MATPTPTPANQNSSEASDSSKNSPEPAEVTGFFQRVQRGLEPEEKPIHPTEAAEIVIMVEEDEWEAES
jgi:hypothetical protein